MRRIRQTPRISGSLHENSIGLRTLIYLRWLGICGQLAAITIVDMFVPIIISEGLCYLVVAASVLFNLVLTFLLPKTRKLSEAEITLMVLFDILQLGALLFVTGGLANPFALLLLVPVNISASMVSRHAMLVISGTLIAVITLLAFFNVTVFYADGRPIEPPGLFLIGFWSAILAGQIFLAVYSRVVTTEQREMNAALLATQMALAREQKLTDLGGVVAATAHELGTPLATIKLVSTELMSELEGQPELQEDARLIRDQADRCRDILRDMGRAGKDDLQLRQAPLSNLLREAAEPHMDRGSEVVMTLTPAEGAEGREPIILRRPEIIHGLRNLVQNAVDFSRSTVWVDGEWDREWLLIRVTDDGDGFPPNVLGRIGEPFVRSRTSEQELQARPEYEGMGLGLFIAKTLLERTGAELTFRNGSDPFLTPEERPERQGAVVEVVWPIAGLLAPPDATSAPNQRFTI